MNEFKIDFSYQARYLKVGTTDREVTDILFVLHGYGQLAPYFLKKFEGLALPGLQIVAPEGLSRFYLEGFSGRVGATWMTKEDRLTDIKNYLTYLNAVYDAILEPLKSKTVRIHLLGFSQGAATVTRWAIQGGKPFDRLILWAGIFPHDMDLGRAQKTFKEKELFLIYGDQDPFITEEKKTELLKMLKALPFSPEVMAFHGAHDIDLPTLRQLF